MIKNSGASLGSDFLIFERNNSLMVQVKILSVENLINFLVTLAKVHLGHDHN